MITFLNKLEVELQKEYEEKIKVIRQVKKLFNNSSSLLNNNPAGLSKNQYSLTLNILTWLGAQSEISTISDIKIGLRANGFKFAAKKESTINTSINAALKRLVNRGLVELVSRGHGRAPSIYKILDKES